MTFFHWCGNKLLVIVCLLSTNKVGQGKGALWSTHHTSSDTAWGKKRKY